MSAIAFRRAGLFVVAGAATYLTLVLLVLGLVLLTGGGVSCQPASCNSVENFLSNNQPGPALLAGAISLAAGTLAARRA